MITIYTLSDPITLKIKYVGITSKTLEKRLKGHLKTKNNFTHKANWIKKLQKENLLPIIEEIDVVKFEEWQFWEQYWISQFKSWGYSLTNHTEGGEGTFGYKHTEEQRLKNSLSNKNKKLSEEHKKKISDSLKLNYKNGYILSKESRKKQSIAKIGELNPAKRVEVRIKISNGNKKPKHTTESKNKISEALRKRICKNETKQKISKISSVKVIQYNLNNHFIKEWESIRKAQKELKITTIYSCLSGKRKTAGGYKWKYKINKKMKERMTLVEYQAMTTRTLPDLGSEQLNILHMILGLNSEFNELYEATDEINVGEEITDIAWYASNYGNIKGINIYKNFSFHPGYYFYALEKNNYIEMLEVEISKLTDLEKKAFAYKKEISDVDRKDLLIKIFERINDCYTAFNLNPYICMERNIEKLKARFPQKFNEHDANNRDLEKERKILSGN